MAGQDPPSLFDHIAEWHEFRDVGLPSRTRIGHDKLAPASWHSIRTARTLGIAIWDDRQIETSPGSELVTFRIPECFEQLTEVMERVSPLPF
jgi:hypothetical protein